MPLKPLSYNQIIRIMSACSAVIETQLGVSIGARSFKRTSKIDFRDSIFVGARFSGEAIGRILLGFSEASACTMAERIYKKMWQENIQFAQVDNEVNELLREFANMMFNEIVQAFQMMDIRCIAEAAELGGGLHEWKKEGQEFLVSPFSMGMLGSMNFFLNMSVIQADDNSVKKVMIVDDSPSLRGMMKQILLDGGYQVVGEAANGREAVATIGSLSPDLVTMDIEMPEINGIQALAAIKVSYPRVKVVMVTSVADKSKVMECLGKGAVNYILKPYEPGKVLEAVARALG